MTDEKSLENVEPLEKNEDTEHGEEEETPLKKPKKKFIMTPARMETLRKGREKRMQNISKKKEIENKLKAEEKQKKDEIKQRVEEEFKKETSEPIAVVSKTNEEDIPKPKLKRAPRKPRKVKTPEPLLTLVDNQGGRTLIFC